MCRRLICLVSLILVLGAAGNARAELVGHWRLDGDAADSSGRGLDGQITGSPNWVDGKVGLAMEIDGDDWIEIPGTSAADGYAGLSGEVTWTVWLKTSNSGAINSLMTLGPAGAAHVQGNRSINIEAAGDIMIRAHSVGALTSLRSTATVADGEWHHVAVTIAFETSGDNDTMKLYIDGDLASGYETTDVNVNQHSGPAADFIMALGARGNTPFVGLIDDARVYDHVLSEEEILVAMAGSGGGNPLAAAPNPADGIKHVGQPRLEGGILRSLARFVLRNQLRRRQRRRRRDLCEQPGHDVPGGRISGLSRSRRPAAWNGLLLESR